MTTKSCWSSTSVAELSPAEELGVALATVNSFQQAALQADGKASMLLAVHVGLAAFVVAQVGEVIRNPPDGLQLIALGVATVLLLASFLRAGYCLVQAIRPRSTPPAGENRFSFPTVANGGLYRSMPPASQLPAEAWALAEVLAMIAMTKNRYISGAVLGVTVFVLVAGVWLPLAYAAT